MTEQLNEIIKQLSRIAKVLEDIRDEGLLTYTEEDLEDDDEEDIQPSSPHVHQEPAPQSPPQAPITPQPTQQPSRPQPGAPVDQSFKR